MYPLFLFDDERESELSEVKAKKKVQNVLKLRQGFEWSIFTWLKMSKVAKYPVMISPYLLGISPRSSIMWARWSSSLE